MQLIANGIIIIRNTKCDNDLEWALYEIPDPNSDDEDLILYSELYCNWIGINFK